MTRNAFGQHCKSHTCSILQYQQHGRDHYQDSQCFTTLCQSPQLGAQADGAEEKQQEKITQLQIKVDTDIPGAKPSADDLRRLL